MKQNLLFFALLFATNVLFAQTKDEADVARAVETLRQAMIDADSAVLDRITMPGLSYGHSSGKIEDKAAYISALASGRSDFKSMNLDNQQITIANNTALVRHLLTGQTVDGGKPGDVKLHVLLVWVKDKKQWKLLARQAVKVQ
ncbi:protein of unknown function [Cnuella takakiae]|uniref:DUF4440 domain-containing protein n=1 Tax=Cnuella takakiae TaxID=1302690 RepID=A0A1M5DTY3_9BACT|nr:nuclear transport factor 2 family protein [Cnuella takakiae]OLY93866.1 DUF4440 domain-containing protein [Cnuella takakiae]SHF70453.1 protein of unknown function [Cnuella takakiae]